jgi:hypothetical protein
MLPEEKRILLGVKPTLAEIDEQAEIDFEN